MPLSIAIIGAGPASCTLAQLLLPLHKSNKLTLTIFERDSAFDFRSQGGTLDLHHDTALKAVKQAGLFEEFKRLARYESDSMKIIDRNGISWLDMATSATGDRDRDAEMKDARPEIDRAQLRKMLTMNFPDDLIQWSAKVTGVEQVEKSGKWRVIGTDFDFAKEYDLVVGADGAYSKVRAALTDVKPVYSGCGGYTFTAYNDGTHDDIWTLVRKGSVFGYSDGFSLAMQYMSDGSLWCTVGSVRPSNWAETEHATSKDKETMLRVLHRDYASWPKTMTDVFECADQDTIVVRNLDMLPPGTRWTNRSGLTLIGDAENLMVPSAGEGVNSAMTDALELANVVQKVVHRDGDADMLYREIKNFEDDMSIRASKTQILSFAMMNCTISGHGSLGSRLGRYVTLAVASEWNFVLRGIMRAVAEVYFGVRRVLVRLGVRKPVVH